MSQSGFNALWVRPVGRITPTVLSRTSKKPIRLPSSFFFFFFFGFCSLGETEKTSAVKEVGYGEKGESSTATSAPKGKEKERGQEEREKRRKGVKRKRKRNRKGGHSEEKEGV